MCQTLYIYVCICGDGGDLIAKLCPTLGTPWAIAYQSPLSLGFPRQEHWNGLPFPSSEDLPNPGIKTGSPALQVDIHMCVCVVCIYVCVCIYICVYSMYICVCVCMCVVCICMYICMCVCMYVCVCVCICVCVYIYAFVLRIPMRCFPLVRTT